MGMYSLIEDAEALFANAVRCKKPSAPDVPESWRLAVDDNRELADILLNALPGILTALRAAPTPASEAEVRAGEIAGLRWVKELGADLLAANDGVIDDDADDLLRSIDNRIAALIATKEAGHE